VVTLTSLSLSLSLLSVGLGYFCCGFGVFFVVCAISESRKRKVNNLRHNRSNFLYPFVVVFNAFLVTIFSIGFEHPASILSFMWLLLQMPWKVKILFMWHHINVYRLKAMVKKFNVHQYFKDLDLNLDID